MTPPRKEEKLKRRKGISYQERGEARGEGGSHIVLRRKRAEVYQIPGGEGLASKRKRQQEAK